MPRNPWRHGASLGLGLARQGRKPRGTDGCKHLRAGRVKQQACHGDVETSLHPGEATAYGERVAVEPVRHESGRSESWPSFAAANHFLWFPMPGVSVTKADPSQRTIPFVDVSQGYPQSYCLVA